MPSPSPEAEAVLAELVFLAPKEAREGLVVRREPALERLLCRVRLLIPSTEDFVAAREEEEEDFRSASTLLCGFQPGRPVDACVVGRSAAVCEWNCPFVQP